MTFIKTFTNPIGTLRAIFARTYDIEPLRQNSPPDEHDVDVAEQAAGGLEELAFANDQRSAISRRIDFVRSRAKQPANHGPSGFVVLRRIGLWLQAPMSTPQVFPWRRVVRWLKAPVGG